MSKIEAFQNAYLHSFWVIPITIDFVSNLTIDHFPEKIVLAKYALN